MAPTLLGQHQQLRCPECRYAFPTSAEFPAEDRGVCPNCGASPIDARTLPWHAGQRVLLWRESWATRPPRRWELVAIRRASQAPGFQEVKRVVGLPGESLEIAEGDLWIDGRRHQKSLGELARVAVPVHDDRCSPDEGRWPTRWRPADSGWRRVAAGWRRVGTLPDSTRTGEAGDAWLEYHHWACADERPPRDRETPVADLDAYDPARSQVLRWTADLLLCGELRTRSRSGRCSIRLDTGAGRWTIDWRLEEGRVELLDEQERSIGRGKAPSLFGGAVWQAAFCDRRVLFAVEGRRVLEIPVTPSLPLGSPAQIPGSTRPWALRLSNGCEARNLRMLRDTVLVPAPAATRTAWVLGPAEWFVIGDNLAVSEDSRWWGPTRDSERIGRVIPVFGRGGIPLYSGPTNEPFQ